MKKTLLYFVTLIVTLGCFNCTVMAEDKVNVILDGEPVIFDVPAQIIDERTMVPLRAIFEKLGATVDWDSDTRTAFAQKGNVNVSIAIDDTTLYKNHESIALDVPAQLIDGRTLVPLRAVSEAFGCDVQWNGDTRTVNIYSKENSNISNQTEETTYIEPPKNIRVVRQEDGAAYVQWDKVEDAEYYHFYYKENSESNFWHDVDEETGEKIKMFYDEEYTTKYWGLEQGKKYNIIVTSVKNGIESNDSEIFTFIFNSSAYEIDKGYYNEFEGVPAPNAPIRESYKMTNPPEGYNAYVYDYNSNDFSAEILSEYMSRLEQHHCYLDTKYADDTGTIFFTYMNDYGIVYISGDSLTTRIIVALALNDVSDFIEYYSDFDTVPTLDCVTPIYSYLGNYHKDDYSTSYVYSYKGLLLDALFFYMDTLENVGYKEITDDGVAGVTYAKEDVAVNITIDETEETICIEIYELVGININNYYTSPTYDTSPKYDTPYSGGYIYSSDNVGGYSTNTKITRSSFPLYLYADDGTGIFLGEISSDKYDRDSISNEYGNYGSKYQRNSIFNTYGDYGSKYSRYSAFNEYASSPPKILDKNGKIVGYLTANKYIRDAISYEEMMVLLKQFNK